jgi:hypothetical protein
MQVLFMHYCPCEQIFMAWPSCDCLCQYCSCQYYPWQYCSCEQFFMAWHSCGRLIYKYCSWWAVHARLLFVMVLFAILFMDGGTVHAHDCSRRDSVHASYCSCWGVLFMRVWTVIDGVAQLLPPQNPWASWTVIADVAQLLALQNPWAFIYV